MPSTPVIAPDAAIALGIASTAMPFARTPEAILERWLRILRLYGDAGVALQALGVGEDRIQLPLDEPKSGRTSGGTVEADVAERVGEMACRIAGELRSETVTTKHLLLAVMRIYGAKFDRVLEAHGCDRGELTERLGVGFFASC